MTRAVLFDTETTGLDPATGDRMIEIAALELINDLPTGQFFHALGEGLADAVHFAVDCGIEHGEPFVIHNKRLDFSFGEFGVFRVDLGIESGFRLLEALP